MSYPKVGRYRHCSAEVRKKYKMTALDFDILLFAAEHDVIKKYDIEKYVTKSKGSVTDSLRYLVAKKYLKIIQKHTTGSGGISALYSINIRGREAVTDFYIKLFPNY